MSDRIDYAKCIELQKQAIAEYHELRDALEASWNDPTDNVRIALELLGTLLPALRETEALLGVHLDEPKAVSTLIQNRLIHVECTRMGGTGPCACLDGCGACDSCGKWLGDNDNASDDAREEEPPHGA